MTVIGITGHRDYIQSDRTSKAIDEALNVIVARYGEARLQLLSPLAEGADRHVVWRALASYTIQLIVPLPLEIEAYLLDFKTPSSKAEFITLLEQADEVIRLPSAGSREESYLAAGMYLLDHCDVLLALWDGSPARGIGGTAQIVAEARRRGLPIAWIKVARIDKEKPSKNTNSTSDVQIEFERFPS